MGEIKNINNKQNQNEMKPTHLITLSAYVDSAQQSTNNVGLGTLFTHVRYWNDQLKEIVTLAHFVPCDANGVPLGKLPEVIHSKEQLALKYKYVRSQKSVIFEGWEVRVNQDSDIVIKNGDLRLVFIRITDDKHLSIGLYLKKQHLGRIQSLADLAAATTNNPIKLK